MTSEGWQLPRVWYRSSIADSLWSCHCNKTKAGFCALLVINLQKHWGKQYTCPHLGSVILSSLQSHSWLPMLILCFYISVRHLRTLISSSTTLSRIFSATPSTSNPGDFQNLAGWGPEQSDPPLNLFLLRQGAYTRDLQNPFQSGLLYDSVMSAWRKRHFGDLLTCKDQALSLHRIHPMLLL